MRPLIDFQHVFHVGYETRAGLRRDHPLLTFNAKMGADVKTN
jgi:hypothetical protein